MATISNLAFQIRAQHGLREISLALKNDSPDTFFWRQSQDFYENEIMRNLIWCEEDRPDDESMDIVVEHYEDKFTRLIIQLHKLVVANKCSIYKSIPSSLLSTLDSWIINSATPKVKECRELIKIHESSLLHGIVDDHGLVKEDIRPKMDIDFINCVKFTKTYQRIILCHQQAEISLSHIKQILDDFKNDMSFAIGEFYPPDCEIGKKLAFLKKFPKSIEYIGHDQGIRQNHPILKTFTVVEVDGALALSKFLY